LQRARLVLLLGRLVQDTRVVVGVVVVLVAVGRLIGVLRLLLGCTTPLLLLLLIGRRRDGPPRRRRRRVAASDAAKVAARPATPATATPQAARGPARRQQGSSVIDGRRAEGGGRGAPRGWWCCCSSSCSSCSSSRPRRRLGRHGPEKPPAEARSARYGAGEGGWRVGGDGFGEMRAARAREDGKRTERPSSRCVCCHARARGCIRVEGCAYACVSGSV
jgi:hypothetical protein